MGWLFDTTGFMTREQCGGWGEILPILNQTANLLIALAYVLIPAILVFMYFKLQRKETIPKLDMLLWFGCFIVLCGVGHVCDYLAFSWPAYRLFTLINALTAIASLGTAAKMPEFAEFILNLPSHAELRRALEEKQHQIENAEILTSELQAREQSRVAEINELERQLQVVRGGGSDAMEILNHLLDQLSSIQKAHR